MTAAADLAARVAWLQLVENRTNTEIAEVLGINRLRIPKLVQQAEKDALASITIRPPGGVSWELAERLRREFGLAEALVASVNSPATVSRLSAQYVCEVLTDGDSLGVSWGRAIQAMVSELERTRNLPQVDVVQLVGGVPEAEGLWSTTELMVTLSSIFEGKAATLLSPLILPDIATARGLRCEPSIANTVAAMDRLQLAACGVGAWLPGESWVRSELDREESLRWNDIVADMCGVLLDAEGRVVHRDLSDRILAITETTLRSLPVRMGVAYGVAKAPAIRAVLKSGLLTVLCTDAATAQLILAAA